MKIVVPNTVRDYEDMVFSSTLPNDFSFPLWNETSTFYRGNMAVYNGRLYRSLEINSGKQPDLYKDDFWYDWGSWDNTTGQVWSSNKTYTQGTLVTHSSGYKHYIYSAIVNNSNVIPSSNSDKWQKIGAINKYRCLYGETENKTECEGDFSISLLSKKADSFYMLGVNGSSATVEIQDISGNVLKSVTEALVEKNTTSWKGYFFEDFSYKTTLGTDVSIGLNNRVVFTIHSSDISRVGNIVLGKSFNVGQSLWGASAGILDFSQAIRDEQFGDVYLSQGSYADRADVTVIVDTKRADSVKKLLTDIRGKEVLFIADERDEGFDMLKIRGFIRDFSVALSNPTSTEISLQIEGLI